MGEKMVDLKDQRFGRLLVLEKFGKTSYGKVIWRCQCDCGNICEIVSCNLISKKTQSCGCLRKREKALDLKGQKFGRLLVLEKTGKKSYEKVIWRCQCDCGNICEIVSKSLISKETQSCGCLRKEKAKKTGEINYIKNFKEYHQDVFKFKTNIPYIQNKTLSKNNTSGIKGVYWDKRQNKWYSKIMFQKKNYHLGYFTNIEDAEKARKIAEERLFGEFLEWYYETYPDKKKKEKEVKQDVSQKR